MQEKNESVSLLEQLQNSKQETEDQVSENNGQASNGQASNG